MKDLKLIIAALTSISLNILALMMLINLIDKFLNPYLILGIGSVLFGYSLIRYYRKKWEIF